MLELQLKSSILQYRVILEHAERLAGLLDDGDPVTLQQHSARLNELQAEAGLHDSKLLAALALDSRSWQAHPLFQERLQLLAKIVATNALLLPRINGMQASTAAELDQLKGGRVAVSGYAANLKQEHRVSWGVS